MDLYAVAQHYLDRILEKDSSDNIRVLLLDKTTSAVISMVTTQSELLKKDVFLVDKLDNFQRDSLRNLSCICFLEPSMETIANLSREIANPNYQKYDLFFNNSVSNSKLERLAESDDLETISKVVEIFMDYLVVNKAFFVVPNVVSPVMSLLLSLKYKPVIRYETNSKMCAKLANAVNFEINSNQMLFGQLPLRDSPPSLLILDRKNDPITPLLFPWTYQAMIHELLGIHNNTVNMSRVHNISEELKEVVVNEQTDQFYKESMYLNFGDLSESLKRFIETYKAKTKTSSNISTITDMKFFLENYPEFKKTSINLSKHMLLSTEIDKKINELRLWEVGELQQSLATNDNSSGDLAELEDLLFDRKLQNGAPAAPLSEDTKLKLLAVYALRYESHPSNQLSRLTRQLHQLGFPSHKLDLIKHLLQTSGTSQRLHDDGESIFEKVSNSTMGGTVNGISFKNNTDGNVYMQHSPRLKQVLMKLFKNKLNTKNYALLKPNGLEAYAGNDKIPDQELVIFIVGGVTYEEARLVAELNQLNPGLKIVIGGTHILDSDTFIGLK
ncbi:hypothetical protein KL925_003500 [Ogataea polymorpha]|nr:hypothetical protein KL937_003149 [Ogataea polymorpha]KAG7888371.1 hypothetical protein KL936_003583 [Ogataea polymorpha]KAG7892452.1 hypothetical protein KL908_003404 [Ogataea polymorpha]KAG7900299.1 hypothetical protein KL935_003042 [Ogataea polymorpha]KAG7902899.1 hypothetical protein KL907_004032 [Ogataea polymorpha]